MIQFEMVILFQEKNKRGTQPLMQLGCQRAEGWIRVLFKLLLNNEG